MNDEKKLTPSRIFNGVIRRLGLRRWFRQVDLIIACRELSTPDVRIPARRNSPMGDPSEFFLDNAEELHLVALRNTFPKRKIKHFERVIADPDISFVVQNSDDDQLVWCFMMHAQKRIPDMEYGFVLPLEEGRDIYQFDGWVNPEYRGLMIGILGTNYGNVLRRSEGFERLYAVMRANDPTSLRLHKRMGFEPVGRIRHRQFGPFRSNKIQFDPGKHPSEGRDPDGGGARLDHPRVFAPEPPPGPRPEKVARYRAQREGAGSRLG